MKVEDLDQIATEEEIARLEKELEALEKKRDALVKEALDKRILETAMQLPNGKCKCRKLEKQTNRCETYLYINWQGQTVFHVEWPRDQDKRRITIYKPSKEWENHLKKALLEYRIKLLKDGFGIP